MIDVNAYVRSLLDTLEDIKVTFYYPQAFENATPQEIKKTLPIISYYELTTQTGFAYDNAEQAQMSTVAIDIWGKSGGECSRIAVQVDGLMQNDGWKREFSRDLPPENGIYHKNIRYSKQIYFD